MNTQDQISATDSKRSNGEAKKPAKESDFVYVTPAVDILESEQEYLIVVDVPGASARDLDIQVEKETLTVVAKSAERGGVAFKRVFVIPRDADTESIDAGIGEGVLKLHIARLGARKPRSISVKQS